MSFDIKNIGSYALIILTFVMIACIYFAPQFSGKTLQQTDIAAYTSASHEYHTFRKESSNVLWTNSMFGGMPTYQIESYQRNNVLRHFEKVTKLFFNGPAGYFISAMIVFFIGLLLLGVNRYVAAIGAITFAFCSNNVVLYEAGHLTKIRSLIFGILILAGVIKTLKKEYLVGGITFALGFGINLYTNHFQMTYIIGLVCALAVIYFLIKAIKNAELLEFGKSIGILALMALIAIGSSASKLWTTYEYSKETMRGKPILEKVDSAAPKSSSETKGLEWEYSMQWSNSAMDVMAGYIPGIVGGGSSEPISKQSATNKFLKKNRARALDHGPMYWGKLPFTSGPVYFGALIVFLFVFSMFSWQNSLKWWGLSAVIFTALLSMGKHFEIMNRLLFDYLPLFNKFRAPSSLTGITSIVLTLVAMMGLSEFIKDAHGKKSLDRYIKPLLISSGILVIVSLFFGLIGPSFFDFTSLSDPRYAQSGFDTSVFEEDRAYMMRRDSFRSLFIVLLGAGMIYFFIKKRFSKYILLGVLAVITLVDILGVDMRYLNSDSFVKSKQNKAYFNERPVDKEIKKDSDIHYRVHDVSSGDPFQNSWASYHHKTFGGYHAAKLQRIQDVIDHSVSKGEQQFLDLLNVKYVIGGERGKERVMRNPKALGNAWFVNNYKLADTNRKELEMVSGIDTKNEAIIHSSFKDNLPNSNNLNSSGSIQLTSYHPDEMKYTSQNSGEGLAVFSEVWYGAKNGWKLYVDGKETPLVRANYLLRAAVIPAGNHELVLKFEPKSYYTGEMISLICSILLILGLIYILYKMLKK